MPLGEILGIFPYTPITARHIDKGEHKLESHVVDQTQDGDPLVPHAEVHLVEEDSVEEVQPTRACEQVQSEQRLHDEGYRQHKRRDQVQKRLVDLLENEELGADFSPA